MSAEPSSDDVAFYSVLQRQWFVGTVAFVNSLRLAGHREPIYLLDKGLEHWQRELLDGEVRWVARDPTLHPWLSKTIGPVRYPAEVMVLIDVDIIVLRHLGELFQKAKAGAVVAFVDPVAHRFHADWEAILDLGPLRRQPYVNAGCLMFPRDLGSRVFHQFADRTSVVDTSRTYLTEGTPDDPFYYADQDLLNAVLSTSVEPGDLELLPNRLAPHPPFSGLEIYDRKTLEVRYPDRTKPLLLHHVLDKPWLSPTKPNVYSRLLPRLLLADDLPVRLELEQIPLRFREGPLSSLERGRVSVAAWGKSQRGRLGIRRRLDSALSRS